MAIYWLHVFTERDGAQESESPDVTVLLNRMRKGDRNAGNQVSELVYSELRRIASREMRHERQDHLLQTTALVHEAYLKLVGAQSLEIQNRGHFFAIASQQMRRILVDHARSRDALRRGGGAAQVNLDCLQIAADERSIDVLVLDEALKEFEQLEPRAAKVVELRYFGGYSEEDIKDVLNISIPTVRRDWTFARSWLYARMQAKG
jgi:RNA polymerase sigma factor (TIGR02999 family)